MNDIITEDTLIKFILEKHLITLTAIGGIFTFAFVGSFKGDILDPLLHFIFPDEFFNFMNITIREGEQMQPPPMPITLRIGNFFKSMVTWMIAMCGIYLLHKYTRFPDIKDGNIRGAVLV